MDPRSPFFSALKNTQEPLPERFEQYYPNEESMGAPIDLNLMRNDQRKLAELNQEVNGIQHILKRLIKDFK